MRRAAARQDVYSEDEGAGDVRHCNTGDDGSQIPALAEPWLLTLSAQIVYSVAIAPDELMKSNLRDLVQKWG